MEEDDGRNLFYNTLQLINKCRSGRPTEQCIILASSFSLNMQCVGPSMMPTFNPSGDVALVEHVSVEMEWIRPGDVVIARSIQNPKHVVCKRVLGLEGDIVPVAGSFGAFKQVKVSSHTSFVQTLELEHMYKQGRLNLNLLPFRE